MINEYIRYRVEREGPAGAERVVAPVEDVRQAWGARNCLAS
jgi:hypothetical protein